MSSATDVVVLPHRDRPVPAQAVLALYRTQDWWPERTCQQVSSVLADGPAVGAWCDDELVGFARAVTDGVLRAYVEDMVVSPRRRGAGTGRALVECLLGQLEAFPPSPCSAPRGSLRSTNGRASRRPGRWYCTGHDHARRRAPCGP